jgi:hypothetical protein
MFKLQEQRSFLVTVTRQDICSTIIVHLFSEGDLFATQPEMPGVLIYFFVAYLSPSGP